MDWFCLKGSGGSCSFAQLHPTRCDTMDGSTPGFPVLCHLPACAQTPVHWLSDAIQTSCPSPASKLYQHQGLFQWVSSSHLVSKVLELRSVSASVLPMNIQDWLPFGWTGWISLKSKGLSRVFSNTIVQKHQFFGTQLSLCLNSHIHMTIGKTIAFTRQTYW